MKEVHLICNAHLDPIWQWEWEEGAAAAISTFQSAADLADKFDYIFCHNEVTLYRYIEEYAPTLFAKIKELIREGKWHIAGGWYLQPDCNMPTGESFVRQIQVGKQYFTEKFGTAPSTALNYDSFGHTKGLVQILSKCGQDSYIFCRPGNDPIPARQFIWDGFAGTFVKANAAVSFYNTTLGKAAQNIRNKINSQEEDNICVLWGVGNHGGGPSAKDLGDIAEMMKEAPEHIRHSTPEAFFKGINPTVHHSTSLRTVMPGCYTSEAMMKQKHAELENTLFYTEKLCSVAAMQGLIEYPEAELLDATRDLLTIEFHDVLCGCTVKAGEENGVMMADHALLILNRLRARAFFALAASQKKAGEGEFPILVFNPHPYQWETEITCEFMLADQNREKMLQSSFTLLDENSNRIPLQVIKEESNLNLDWRKRIIFRAKLHPLALTRFSLYVDYITKDNTNLFLRRFPAVSQNIVFDNGRKYVEIDCKTGLLKSFKINGKEYVQPGALLPLALKDNEDPWAMQDFQLKGLGTDAEPFRLMAKPDGPFAGMDSIQITEDGDICQKAECFMKQGNTKLRMEYVIYKNRDEIDVNLDVYPGDVNRIYKLSLPCDKALTENGTFIGQTAYGAEPLYEDGRECVAQRYIAVKNHDGDCLALMNRGTYGSSYQNGEIRQSLIRTASYCSHPIDDKELVPTDRYVKKIDMGERRFRFRLAPCREEELERIAAEFNAEPYALNAFPVNSGAAPAPLDIAISDNAVTLSVMKKEDGSKRYLFRLFNGTEENRLCTFGVNGASLSLSFLPYEVKTVSLDGNTLKEEAQLLI